MAYETIKTEVDGNVGILTLNRPDTLNAFTTKMRAEFRAAAAELEADPEVRCIVLTGEGRAFSAGADLKETAGLRDTTVERVLVEEYKPCILAITNSNKPWIAAVGGPASGIGAAFAQACDLMIMGEGAYIYMAFAAIALADGAPAWLSPGFRSHHRGSQNPRCAGGRMGNVEQDGARREPAARGPRLGSPAGAGGASFRPSRQEGLARRHGSGSGGDHRSGIGAPERVHRIERFCRGCVGFL